MKAKHGILYLLLAIFSSSCIREEAPNAEADILSCRLPGVVMTTSPIITNNSINIFVGPGTDISSLAPEFTLTPGVLSILPVGRLEISIRLSNIPLRLPMAFGRRSTPYPLLIRNLLLFTILRIRSADRNTTSS